MVGSLTSTWVTAPTSVPVAVPDKIFGLTLFLDFIDRCHSLCSLTPPPAAVASLPILDNRTACAFLLFPPFNQKIIFFCFLYGVIFLTDRTMKLYMSKLHIPFDGDIGYLKIIVFCFF